MKPDPMQKGFILKEYFTKTGGVDGSKRDFEIVFPVRRLIISKG